MFRFEKLEIWNMAIQYGNHVYDVVNTFPKEEMFSLSSQLKRASLSISSNIAEGSGSATTRDFANFLDIAIKSTLETVSQLYFAKERKYITDKKLQEQYEEAELLVKKIHSLKKYLSTKKKESLNV